jgi:TolB-like protein/DNA-binding winged helix-turn-helix (wHTH) protein/Tfp pilus assembly protein PilF
MKAQSTASRARFGLYEFDPASGDVWKQGVRVRLHGRPLQVLQTLIERAGDVVTRKELQERLWPRDTFVEFENGLNNAISRLRDALGDHAANPRFIETVPRRGYRFIAPVAWVSGPAEVQDAVLPDPGIPRRRATAHLRWIVAAGVAALLAAVMLHRTFTSNPAIGSIAVLPFATGGPGGEARDEYVAFGMTDALISELSRSRDLKVISQTSTLRYRGTRKPLPDIARELGVDAVIEGSVVHEGERVRITVQLIDAASDTHLWSESYRHDSSGILAAQGELARSVVRSIHARLTNAPPPDTSRPERAVDPRVREAHLKGRFFLSQGTEVGRTRARAFFEEALALDPEHAPSHAGMADYYILTDSLPADVAEPGARTHVRRALDLDDTLADAHASRGFLHYYAGWDWAAAERDLRRALDLDPGHTRARRWYAMYLAAMGRHGEARTHIQQVLDLDPVSLQALDSAAQLWLHARDADSLLEQSRRILELHPSSPQGYEHQAAAHMLRGDFAGAIAPIAEGLRLSGRAPLFLMLQAQVHGALGDAAIVREVQDELLRASGAGFVPPFLVAAAWLGSGDHDKALDWLESGYDGRDAYLVFINASPWMDALRPHRRYQELLRRMNFPANVSN